MGKYSELINSLQEDILKKTSELERRNSKILDKMNIQLDKYIIMDQVEDYDKLLKDFIFDKLDSSVIKISNDRNNVIFSFSIIQDEVKVLQEFHKLVFEKMGIKRPEKKI